MKQNLVRPSFYLHGVNGGEDDLVGGDDYGEEFRGELQHCLIFEHHSASSLIHSHCYINDSQRQMYSNFQLILYNDLL